MKLTPKMRAALETARKNPLRRVHAPGPGQPKWPAHPATIRALVRHGLIRHVETTNRDGHRTEVWDCTEDGRKALLPPERYLEDRPAFCARSGTPRYRLLPPSKPGALGRWTVDDRDADEETLTDRGYTTDPSRASDQLEVPEVSTRWRVAGEEQRLEAQDRRKLSARVARSLRRAA